MVLNNLNKGNLWVYDIETLASLFTYTAKNITTNKVVSYVIHNDRNQLTDLVEHLLDCDGMIGFNNINFDYPVIHFILEKYDYWVENNSIPTKIISDIYGEAQRVIDVNNRSNTFGASIRLKDIKIPQLDLFRIWHFNNKARSTSLKALQVAMNYSNVMDMPINHNRLDIRLADIDTILEYNLNDVESTVEFLNRSIKKIQLRKGLKSKYGIQCLNYPDSKIGEELVLKLYCDKTGYNYWDVKEMRSKRSEIRLNDVIFDHIKFESKIFNNFLNKLKGMTLKKTKGEFKDSIIFEGFKYDYGSGGIKYVSSL